MVTIAYIVENYVTKRPFLQEALGRGILNHAALAEQLILLVERELGQKVKFSAVNMAIRRLAEKTRKAFPHQPVFPKDADITIRSSLVGITAVRTDAVQGFLKKAFQIISLGRGDFLTVTIGINEVMIITNTRHHRRITQLFQKATIRKTLKGLSSLTVMIPEDSYRQVGLFFTVSREFAWENIPIVDVVSTLTEMTILVKEEHTARSFECLKRLVGKNMNFQWK